MKIALINDLHFGIKNDSPIMLEYQREFYSNIFLPYLKENDIFHVDILGDIFDKRKVINNQTLYSAKEMLFDILALENIETRILVGNHCSFYKNTLSINSPQLLLGHYDNITIIDSPIEYSNTLYLPWITDSNYEESMNMIENSDMEYVFGHLELFGFDMNVGHKMDKGMNPDIFKKYKKVISGHYHTRSTDSNIHYLGAQYELSWIDFEDIKGFHTFEVETGNLEFIENPNKLFYKLTYNEDLENIIPNITNKIVKVIVQNKTSQKKFDKYFEQLSSQNPFELKIIENHCEYDSVSNDVDLTIDSTETIISKYIDSCELSVEKEKLKMIFKQLHNEAILV